MAKILTLLASNNTQSINRTLLNIASQKITGHTLTKVEVADHPMPMYGIDTEEQEGFPDTAKQLRDILAEHDAFIIASPEHNGAMPAVFKNTIDWLSRLANADNPIFGKKPVLLLSTSPGPNGGATNLKTLTQLMPWWGADMKGSYSLGSFYDTVIDGVLTQIHDQELTEIINDFVGGL
ncbi:MAG: NAD(P)H-dependent oxidoreductase [Colwellia sp.]|nr:NAD(P)H-dependent oxidoreductase [Colwellia sp.]